MKSRPPSSPLTDLAWHQSLADALRSRWETYVQTRERARKKPTPRRIHALRIETRRLAAQVSLAGTLTDAKTKRLRRTLKRTLRLTAAVRDADVHASSLEALRPAHPVLKTLVAELRHERKDAARTVSRKLTARANCRRINRLMRALRERAVQPNDRAMLARVGDDALTALTGALAAKDTTPEALHRSRLAVKKVRYLVEVLPVPLGACGNAGLASLRTWQRTLGQIHDADLLISRLERFAQEHPSRRPDVEPVRRLLARRRQRWLRTFCAQGPPLARGKPQQA